ncbi:MAG: hypothetical protein IJY92_00845 [Alphaproteobacteria bacterium]|nr:hypothetical protein [Alphaproteobacteria bacterium]
MSDKIKFLKFVRKNDVVAFNDFNQNKINHYEKMGDLNFKLDGTTLLHEAVSAEMICFLLHHNVDIMLKNKDKKSPEHVLKKKIKALAQQKYIQKKQGRVKLVAKLAVQLKQLRLALKMLKSIRTFVAKGWDENLKDMDANVILLNAFKTNSFKNNITSEELSKVANFTAYHAIETKKYIEKTNKYLENAGFDKEKIKKTAALIQRTRSDIFLMDESKKTLPKVLYRGTINPNDKARPLDHFGSFVAARERLNSLERAIHERRVEWANELGINLNKIVFQIKPILLKVKRPFRIPELGNHELRDYKRLMLHVLLMKEKGRKYVSSLYEGNDFQEGFASRLAGQKLPKEFTYIFEEPFQMPLKEVERELFLGGLYPLEKTNPQAINNVNRKNLCYQRIIRFFERQGYDGFVYKNGWEDVGKDSYICLRPSSVVEPLKTSEKELFLPAMRNEKALKLLDEESKISSCKEISLTKDNARKLYDISMGIYYGKEISAFMYCVKKTTKFVQSFLKKNFQKYR